MTEKKHLSEAPNRSRAAGYSDIIKTQKTASTDRLI